MDIPAVFARFADDGVTLSEGHFKRTVPVLDGPPLPVSAVSEKIDKENRNPVLIADYNSLYGRYFCEKIMKHVRVRGASMWLMTYIETTEDLFDAFNYNADVVVSPYHASESDAVLRDVYDVSDSFIPAVYVYRGKGVSRKGKLEDLRRMLDRLYDIGFHRISVLDADISLSEEEWAAIADRYPSAIPFPGWVGGIIPETGFEARVVPVRFRRSSPGTPRRPPRTPPPPFYRFRETPDVRAISCRRLSRRP